MPLMKNMRTVDFLSTYISAPTKIIIIESFLYFIELSSRWKEVRLGEGSCRRKPEMQLLLSEGRILLEYLKS